MEQHLPTHGNFRRYYGMRSARAARLHGESVQAPARADERILSLVAWLATTATAVERVLDIGCNAAKPLIELCQCMESPPKSAIGVDIDPVLIHQAQGALRKAWSQMRPAGAQRDSHYFPIAFSQLFSPLPFPPHDIQPAFPNTITFYIGDWQALDRNKKHPLAVEDRRGYDLILGFSLTKWIHLNDGDAGLIQFLARLAKCLRPGGVVALEIQPWKSYDQARSLSSTLRKAYTALRIRPDDMEWILTSVFGLQCEGAVGTGGGFGFKRPILVFRRPRVYDAAYLSAVHASLAELPAWPWVMQSPKM